MKLTDEEKVAKRILSMNQKTDADRDSCACDGYQAFRVAGELFGRLQHELGFGELIMRTPSWGPSAPPAAMSYDWSFNAKGERYVVSETVSFVELIHLRSVEAFAVSMAARWKEQAKQRAGTESA